ncbi:MAG: rod shape-determining protein MreD [Neisseria sp.]|nr:rod shape-determining protein MreD [Neisseria sp.]
MNDFEPFYNRLPTGLIVSTFAIAILLDFIPSNPSVFFWLPEFSALILLYWALNAPHIVSIGIAFLIGLIIDIGTAAPLGQHALSYVLITFVAQHYQRQIMLRGYGEQSVAVCIALLANVVILMVLRLLYDHRLGNFSTLVSPIIGALLWPLLNKIMLTVLNFRRNRR